MKYFDFQGNEIPENIANESSFIYRGEHLAALAAKDAELAEAKRTLKNLEDTVCVPGLDHLYLDGTSTKEVSNYKLSELFDKIAALRAENEGLRDTLTDTRPTVESYAMLTYDRQGVTRKLLERIDNALKEKVGKEAL